MHEWIGLIAHIAMGLSLAACAGMRAFLPLFVVGLAGRLDLVPLAGPFEWMAGGPALIVFGVAVAVELLGDKIPFVDHLLDAFQLLVKPVAGALVAASVVTDWAPLYLVVASVTLGGSLAAVVHLTKAKLRLLSTASTGGAGNPVVSLAEDVSTAAASIGALFFPALVALVVLVALSVIGYGLQRVKRRIGGRGRAASPLASRLRNP